MRTILTMTLLIAASAAFAERPMNELPMYGGQHEPSVERNTEYSKCAALLGWQYYYRGDLDTAIKRFNQAWMFDRKNPQAYWGFGVIMGRRAPGGDTKRDMEASIRFLGMAKDLEPNNGRIIGDLAFSHALLGHWLTAQGKDGTKEYSTAEALFKRAYELDPKYPPIPSNWSVLKFYTGDYRSAKKLSDEAKALGLEPDPAYAKELKKREPR